LPGKPPLRGPAFIEAALISCKDPLAGPGPLAPAVTGTPVSATVGVMTGRVALSVAFTGSGDTIPGAEELNWEMILVDEEAGIGAGERLR